MARCSGSVGRDKHVSPIIVRFRFARPVVEFDNTVNCARTILPVWRRRARSHVSRLRRCAQADRHDHRRSRRAQDSRPPRAAQHSPADRPRQSASRARVRLVIRDASELRTSKEARCGGAVPRVASPAPPAGSRRLPRLPAAPKRGSEGPDPLVRGLETSRESARTATLCRGSSAWSSYPQAKVEYNLVNGVKVYDGIGPP